MRSISVQIPQRFDKLQPVEYWDMDAQPTRPAPSSPTDSQPTKHWPFEEHKTQPLFTPALSHYHLPSSVVLIPSSSFTRSRYLIKHFNTYPISHPQLLLPKFNPSSHAIHMYNVRLTQRQNLHQMPLIRMPANRLATPHPPLLPIRTPHRPTRPIPETSNSIPPQTRPNPNSSGSNAYPKKTKPPPAPQGKKRPK